MKLLSVFQLLFSAGTGEFTGWENCEGVTY